MERPWVKSPSYEAAIRAIVAARKSKGLSQREVAERLGKPRSFVSKIENRERRIDIVEFVALARALGVDPSDMLAGVLKVMPAKLEF